MIIKYLQLENFKSYSGKQIIGPFNKKMSCLIGPNGSGKSNIIDSILFVFGFRSNKLRQQNIQNLIHCSANWKSKNCKVSIYFEIVENQELKISRTVNQNGHSYYEINNTKTTLQYLKKVLLKYGVDMKTNHFIILQGEIQNISVLNALQLLAHIEYICGSQRFIEQIEENKQFYEKIQNERTTKQISTKLKQKQILKLKRQKELCEMWIFQKRKVLTLQNIILIINKKMNMLQIEKNKKEIQRLQLQKKKQESIKEQKLMKQIQLQKQIKKLKMEIQQVKKVYSSEFNSKNKLQIQIQTIQRQIQFKEKDFTTFYKKRTDIEDEIKLLMVDRTNQIPQLKKEILELNIQFKQKFRNPNKIIEKLKIVNEINQIQKNLENLITQKKSIEIQLKQNELSEQKASIQKLFQKQSQIRYESKKLKIQLSKKYQKINLNTQSLNSTRYKIKALQNHTIFTSAAVQIKKELKKASQCLLLKGIKGTLRDVCWIDKKYQNALNIICPQLDYLIVDNYNNAVETTKYLKQRKLGKVTIIIFDQINQMTELKQNAKKFFRAPENSHRIFDLIHLKNQEYHNILYWTLRDTLVTQNLDIAVKIAYGKPRYRVVTENGYLIDSSGAMTYSDPVQADEQLQVLKYKVTLIQKQIEQQKNKCALFQAQIDKRETNLKKIQQYKAISNQKMRNKQELAILQEKHKYLVKQIEKYTQKLKKQKVLVEQFAEIDQFLLNSYSSLKKQIQNQTKKLKNIQSAESAIQKLISKKEIQFKKEKKTQNEIDNLNTTLLQNSQLMKNIEIKLVEISTKLKNKENQLFQKDQIKFLNQLEKNNCKNTSIFKQKIEKLIQTNRNLQNLCESAQIQIQKVKSNFQKLSLYKILQPAQIASSFKKKVIYIPTINQSQKPQNIDMGLIDNYKVRITLEKQKLAEIQKQKIDLTNIETYQSENKIYQEQFQQLKQIIDRENHIKNQIDSLKTQRFQVFINAYNIIQQNFKNIYRNLTGGDAQISLLDSIDPFSQGLELLVRPVNKSWKRVNILSGGQKTMTSLALIFAFSQIKKCPFYFMDEIDAALDYRNTSLLAKFIKDKKESQFIIVSLRRNMYQQCKTLTGIYKIRDQTTSITINTQQFEQKN